MSDTILQCDGLSKTFRFGLFPRRQVEAVKRVSLNIRRGDIFGFLGPNGAGKTTTVRCILGLTQPDLGRIVRFGKEHFDPVDFFSCTAYCPEESHFPPYLTGREMLGHWCALYGLDKTNIPARVTRALESVGIAEAADRRIGTYSKGMKQRVGIAGCLLSEPKLVILDEPARGLDPLARHIVRNALLKLAKAGATIFMNSHILSEVERVCTRVAIIVDGVIERDLEMAQLERGDRIDVLYRPGPGGTPTPENAVQKAGGMLSVTVSDTAQLALLVSAVAEAGGEVISAAKRKIDLESYFIRVVGEGDK